MTEGSQRYILPTIVDSLDIKKRRPLDSFQLRINSNYIYSRRPYPKNYCYNFIIEFPSSSSNSLQYRISQCYRYHVVHFQLPIRGSKLVQQWSYTVPFNSHVIKSPPLQQSRNSELHFDARFGMMSSMSCSLSHEELQEIHVTLNCQSLNERFDTEQYERSNTRKLPPIQKQISSHTNKELIHLRNSQATLLYNQSIHSNLEEFLFSPYYSLSPPVPRNQFDGYETFGWLLSVNQSSCDLNQLLYSRPRVISTSKNGNLSPIHLQIFPNDSQTSYDLHHFDQPSGLETDLTLIFYKENNLIIK